MVIRMGILKYICAYFLIYGIIVVSMNITFKLINKDDFKRYFKRILWYLNIFFDPIGIGIIIAFSVLVIFSDFTNYDNYILPARVADTTLKVIETYIAYISGVSGILVGLAFVPFSFLKKENLISIFSGDSTENIFSPFMRVAIGYFLSFAFLLLTKSAVLEGVLGKDIEIVSSIAVMLIPYFILCIIKELFTLVHLFDMYIKKMDGNNRGANDDLESKNS